MPDLPETKEMLTLGDLAKRSDVDQRTVRRWCNPGLKGQSGFMVRLKRWKTEIGWVSSEAALVEFRKNLNAPLYTPESQK